MASKNKLKRQFGLVTTIAILVGQVIGVGIFLTPAGMAKSLSSPFWLLVIWLVMGTMALCGALCYGEFASRFPDAGGSYVYLREGFGKPMAFLYGWMVLFVLDPGLAAVMAVGMSTYLSYLLPLSPVGIQIVAISTIVIVGLANIFGARIGGGIVNVLTYLKIGTLLFIVAVGFLGAFGDWSNFTPFYEFRSETVSLFPALSGALVGAFFAFGGWWEVSRVAGEVKTPQKNLPRALAIGVLLVTTLYILISAVFWYLVPIEKVTNEVTFAAMAGEALFGSAGGSVFAAIVVVSVLGNLVALMMAAPRVYYAMAKDRVFFKRVGRLHPKFNTPMWATLIQMTLGSIIILLGNFSQIIPYFLFMLVFFIAITVAGLFVIRRQEFDGYKTPLYPLTPILFVVVSAIVLVMIFNQHRIESLLGLGVVLLGLPVYFLFSWKRKGSFSKLI